MTAVVVDTSVAVKWLFDENGSEVARSLLQDTRLYAPDFLLAEMANTLWSKQRRKVISAEVADGLYAVIEGLGMAFTPMAQLLDRSRAVAAALDLTVYDALYVALAERLNLPLATADAGIVEALRKSAWPISVSPVGI